MVEIDEWNALNKAQGVVELMSGVANNCWLVLSYTL